MPLRVSFPFHFSDHAAYDGCEGEDALRGSARASFFACDDQYRDDYRTDADRWGAASPGQLRGVFLYYDLHVLRACLERLQRAVNILRSICHPQVPPIQWCSKDEGFIRGAPILI